MKRLVAFAIVWNIGVFAVPWVKAETMLDPKDIHVLMADRAKRNGTLNVCVWGKPEGRAWVGNWQRPEDSFQWTVEAPAAAAYEVSVLAQGTAGAEAEIVGETGRLLFHLPKGWDKLALPQPLLLPEGRSTITLRLLKPDDAKLKSLGLACVSARAGTQRRITELRAPTRWLREAKYGLMFQWGAWGYPQHGPAKPWPKMIEDFDVAAFARMVESTGAGYVIWSVTWRTYHFPAPIKAIDRILPGRTSPRDLVGELADALAKRGIKLMLYYHEGHPDKEWWERNWDPADPDRKERFVNNLCAVLTEVGQRYRAKVAGWFFDDGMLFYPAPFEQITRAAKTGHPARLVSYNSWVLPRLTEFQEVFMGEGFGGSAATAVGSDGIFPDGPQRGLFAHGMLILDGPDWGIFQPDTTINRPVFTPEEAVGLVSRAAERGQTLSFNLLMYEDGAVSSESLAVMRAVRKAIRGAAARGDAGE
ncbi:alpha-L-fucosidase [bacterium]|nr:alpha-L-fucosidase [bacterium]